MAARDDHSSGTRLAARLTRPTRTTRRERLRGHGAKWGFVPCRRPPLFGLAPGGVCPAAPVARGAVRSCRTISPLPAAPRTNRGNAGGLFSVALSLGSPPPAVGRHRIPVEPGLSSARRASPACSGRPAVWRGETCAQARMCVKRRPWQSPVLAIAGLGEHRSLQSPVFAIRGVLAIGPAIRVDGPAGA